MKSAKHIKCRVTVDCINAIALKQLFPLEFWHILTSKRLMESNS